MKTIIKALFLLIALTAVPVFAQSDYEATNARAEAGDAEAQAELGFIYGSGTGIAPNIRQALRWFRLAAEQGNARAQYNLGVFYGDGIGVAQDDNEAVKWYRLAADQGFARAQSNLGSMFSIGRGVAQDDNEAVKWYRLAAEQGDAGAQFNLGQMYGRGAGVRQDYKESAKWYRLAANQGFADAQMALTSFQALALSREYFIDGLVIVHTERQFSNCSQGGDYSISISGDIGPDSSFALEELLNRSPNCINQNGVVVSRTIVNLSSAGGLIEDGYKMGRLFRANGVHTQINDNLLCASSCAIAYLGGEERTMSEDAAIMFHSPYLLELNARGERVPNCDVGSESSAKLLSYYQEMTGDEEGQRLMDRTLSYCSTDDGWVLRGANAAELFGVATKI